MTFLTSGDNPDEYEKPDSTQSWTPEVSPLWADNPNVEIDPDWFGDDE